MLFEKNVNNSNKKVIMQDEIVIIVGKTKTCYKHNLK